MASAVVSSVTTKLRVLLTQEALVLFEVKDHFEWIQNELRMMQCFLKDADSRQNREERVKEWVKEIIQVSYDAEDFIETFLYSQSIQVTEQNKCEENNAPERRRGFAEWVSRCVCIVGEIVSELKTQYMVSKEIKKIRGKIRDIKERRETYGIKDIDEGRREPCSSIRDLEGRREDIVMFEEPQLVGQHEEFRTLRDQLMTEEQRRRVISIFGIGGSGKTTLAKKILNDVKDQFDCHALVYVSQQCKIKDILVRILKGVAGDSAPLVIDNLGEVDLGLMLRDKYLRKKRYLVVFDNIWTREAWDSLILRLPDDGNKSRVLVTTRIRDVTLHADPSSHQHEKHLLNKDESWELFMRKIFPGKDPLTACPSELEEIGRKILAKCGGLPLAILVLGGLLATEEKTIRVWSDILDRVPHHLTESSELCMEILALSYWDLPHDLKPCFLYLGLFPEDYEISSRKLIRLWIAEGFIEQRDGKIMEDVAEEYLKKLVSRSMIQVASKRSNGSIHKCRIHDLLRELSISEARENNFFTVFHNDDYNSSSSTSVRRLAVYRNIDGDETKNHSSKTLRSIFYFFDSEEDVFKLPDRTSKLLRVMNAESEEPSIFSIPNEVGEFVHLKCLESSLYCRLLGIPPSIGNLSSLQTLKVFEHSGEVKLPNTIWNLKELRHLHANSQIKGHPHLSNLKNLQTLSLEGGSWIGEGLGKLTNLRKLKIRSRVNSYHDTLPCCIEKLRNLRVLQLGDYWTWTIPSSWPSLSFLPFTHHRDLYKIHLSVRIEKLPEWPPNLVELYLRSSELEQDAISALEKLQHLKILKLGHESYIGKQMICSPKGFPELEFLELQSLPLEEWKLEEGAMISLKSVKHFGMYRLKAETLPERVRALWKEGDKGVW